MPARRNPLPHTWPDTGSGTLPGERSSWRHSARTPPSRAILSSFYVRSRAGGSRKTPKPRWLVELLEEANKPFSEEKKARLDEFMRLAQEFRERMPSIAPETAESLIRQVRDEADGRP